MFVQAGDWAQGPLGVSLRGRTFRGPRHRIARDRRSRPEVRYRQPNILESGPPHPGYSGTVPRPNNSGFALISYSSL